VFEEILVCGYVVQSLRGRFGVALAANASIALRMSFHLYQGPAAFLTYSLFGLLFTLFYVRTGRLWPLIVAHALLSVIELTNLVPS
jgi:membrane protease YdiL (CAAX protease family)